MTPMQFQYLVGLCCIQTNPEAVDITIGDTVMDAASEEERDVDVTVTIKDTSGTLTAFKGFEAKKERGPLDVSTVEQLCIKLKDMPKISYRAIVSASGFSKGSKKKAAYHGVDLFQMKLFTKPLGDYFPSLGAVGFTEKTFKMRSSLLCWKDWSVAFESIPDIPLTQLNNVTDLTELYSINKKPHGQFLTIKNLIERSLKVSTDVLCNTLEFAGKNEPWPYQYIFNLLEEEIFIKQDNEYIPLDKMKLSGHLYWEYWSLVPEFHVLENISTGEAFAGAIITPYRPNDDRLCGFILKPNSNDIPLIRIALTDKQKNMIYKLKLRFEQQNI